MNKTKIALFFRYNSDRWIDFYMRSTVKRFSVLFFENFSDLTIYREYFHMRIKMNPIFL